MDAPAADTADLTEPTPPSARVLLVDDQAVVGVILRTILATDPDIEVLTCQHAPQALETACQVRPTVILQDLGMPGMDGLELVRAYRQKAETQQVPIIVLSANDDPQMKRASFAAGANDYLVKLPEPIELTARIRYHARSYRTLQERDSAYRALHASQQALLKSNEELRRLTQVDGLTGVSNRRYFDECLAQEWTLSALDGTELALLMIDVDHFKAFNDRHGHQGGDEALRAVAQVIASHIRRPADLAARYGGEEFAVVLPNTDAKGAWVIAEHIRKGVQHLPRKAGDEQPITVSIGMSTWQKHSRISLEDLLLKADQALYQAKHSGRNRIVDVSKTSN